MLDLLLDARSITKSFAGVRALNGVSFDLRAGEVHALVGENGAGKSTFTRIVTGAEAPDAGSLVLSGRAVSGLDPMAAHRLGVAAIYQQPALFPHLTVAENIALALERGGLSRRIDWTARADRARSLLSDAGAVIDPSRLASSLSMPEQQIVEIAKAIGADARIVIMDEPTASLPQREVDRLFTIVRRLREQGVGVIYISHRLHEVFAIADRITILRDGELVATRDAASIDAATLIQLMVGRELAAIFPKRPVALGDIVLDVRHLSNAALGVRDVSFDVRAGEILGVAGLVGAGRTELAETLFGLSPATDGEIRIRGARVRIESPREAMRLGMAYLPEDRPRHGVIPQMDVAANISLPTLHTIATWGMIDRSAERASARRYVDRLRIKAPSPATIVDQLSGGNQQKVAFARWLETKPSLLIFDEPTQGVDVGAKSEIHELIQDLSEQGLAILLISSELPEILGMSDRIAVMRGGAIAAIVPRAEATQARILDRALGHLTSDDRRP